MLHDKLKQIRKQNGYTQDEVAVKLNVVRQTVSKWEKGVSVPDANSMLRLAELYGVNIYDLLEQEPNQRKGTATPERTDKQKKKPRKIAIAFALAAILTCLIFICALSFEKAADSKAAEEEPLAVAGPTREDYAFDTFSFFDLRPGDKIFYTESITIRKPGDFKCHANYSPLGLSAEMGLIDRNGKEYLVSSPGCDLTDTIENVPAGEYQIFIRNSESNLQYADTSAEPLTISGAAVFGFTFR